MTRYADLLAIALNSSDVDTGIVIERVNLALSTQKLRNIPEVIRSWVHHIWIAWMAKTRLRKIQADVFHVTDGSHAYVMQWLPKDRTLVTVHDIIPYLQLKRRFDVEPPGKTAAWLIRKSIAGLHGAGKLVSDSHNTKSDLLHETGIDDDRIDVVHLAVLDSSAKKAKPGVSIEAPEPYIFHIGNSAFYKNRSGVVRIFARVRVQHPIHLIMAGPPPDENIKALIMDLDLDSHVTFILNPSDDELDDLYCRASLLLFPSLYEGFGWPPLEAMLRGCPVVGSNAGSLPEVIGDAGLMGDPEDEQKMADLCLGILKDENLADELTERGREQVNKFKLEKLRENMANTYRSLLDIQSTGEHAYSH